MKEEVMFANPFRILSPRLGAGALRLEELHHRPVSESVSVEEGLMIMLSKLIEMTRWLPDAVANASEARMEQCETLAKEVHEQERILTGHLVSGNVRKDLLKGLLRLPYRLERIGDMLAGIFACCRTKDLQHIPFTDKARGELEQLFAVLLDILKNLRDAFRSPNRVILEAILAQCHKLSQLIEDCKQGHWERLETGFCHVHASSMYRDMLDSTHTANEYVQKTCLSMLELGQNQDLVKEMMRLSKGS
jgi:Na+/phosphate symporter